MMNEQFDKIYEECITKLKNGQRPQIKLTEEMVLLISSLWPKDLKNDSKVLLRKILCILDNSQTSTNAFDQLLLKTLEREIDDETMIYMLSVIQKQSITQSFKSGHIIDYKFFETFKNLLKTNNPELKEWTLRTIESLGPLSLRLKKEVLAARPGLLKQLNHHQKNCAAIIDYMEKDWRRLEERR